MPDDGSIVEELVTVAPGPDERVIAPFICTTLSAHLGGTKPLGSWREAAEEHVSELKRPVEAKNGWGTYPLGTTESRRLRTRKKRLRGTHKLAKERGERVF